MTLKHVSPPRVLITVPHLSLAGGVANYYRVLRPFLEPEAVYLEIGARPAESGRWRALRRVITDYVSFRRAAVSGRFELVHLNPSLGIRAAIRDGLFLLIAKAYDVPVLVFFHGWDPAVEAGIRNSFVWLFRAVYGRADALVVLAREFEQSLRTLGITAPVTLETTPVEDAMLDGQPANVAAYETCNVLYLSRLDHRKGLLEAIEATALLCERGLNVTLTIAGDGPERAAAEVLARARAPANIRFLGHVEGSERVDAFRRAQVFLFPSTFGEGMPTCVLEAMAFGLPVVTRAVGGIRDFFENERMGYVTESRDPAVIADLVEKLAVDPGRRAAMGRYNRYFASQRFAASNVAVRLLEIYDQVRRQPRAG